MTTEAPNHGPARKPDGPLRRGWTTGACATAAAAGAYRLLLTDAPVTNVTIRLPKGEKPIFALQSCTKTVAGARASVIKDAGDDPDVTHGAEIIVDISLGPAGSGISFHAGDGVGTVTLPGLPVTVGEPAINPGPRGMIKDALDAVAEELDTSADVSVTISIPDGEILAEKTMNPRLGIKGGLSVLGTTGIVIPYSCASWINSIHRGIDVARNLGIDHLIAATGSTSEAAAMRDFPKLSEQSFIDMGDFAGGMLKYLRRNPVDHLTFAGGAAKLAKLAQGHLDLHSKRSRVDMDLLATSAKAAGAGASLQSDIRNANTTMEAITLCRDVHISIADQIAIGARETAMAALAGGTHIDVRVYDRQGVLIGSTDRA